MDIAVMAAGGILADEVGLGKTVDVIALMLLHPPPLAGASVSGGPCSTRPHYCILFKCSRLELCRESKASNKLDCELLDTL